MIRKSISTFIIIFIIKARDNKKGVPKFELFDKYNVFKAVDNWFLINSQVYHRKMEGGGCAKLIGNLFYVSSKLTGNY